MTPNTILEPASRSADATDNDDAMTEGLVANGEAVAVIDDRPGGHLDAMIVPKGAAEPRRDGAKELMRGGWSDIDWPVLGWIGGIHIAALGGPVLLHLVRAPDRRGARLGDRRAGRLSRLPPSADARELWHIPACAMVLPSLAASLEKGRR